MPKDLQTPFDVAVVMFTKRTGALASAVRSVFAQDFDGRVQVLVATDGPQADRAALADLRREVPDRMALSIVDLGYSTARSRGGLYAPEAGGALRTALTLLANARHVAYLSEVNVFSPNHLSSLKQAIGDRAWAWTQRLFADARNGAVICRDDWESAGPGASSRRSARCRTAPPGSRRSPPASTCRTSTRSCSRSSASAASSSSASSR